MNTKFFFLISLSSILSFCNVYSQQVSIYYDSTKQVIRGFGGIHITSWTGRQLTADMMEKAFDNDPGEMGLTIFRMQIGEDSTSWRNELPIARYAKSKGAIVFASPWNPPAYMRKVKGTYNNETDYELLDEYYDDYANHLNRFIKFMADSGVSLYAVSIQNEPDWHGWTTWTSQQMIKFLRNYGHLIQAPIIAPESYGYSRSFIDPILNDSIANARIAILGTHIYGTTKANYYYPLALQKGKEVWMTEHLLGSDNPASNTWSLALELADEINTCLDAGMSAYVYWYIRRFYGLINDAGNITDKGYVMAHFSKFIRPGSRRVWLKSANLQGVGVTAYKTDSSATIVVVNKTAKSVQVSFNLVNFPTLIDTLVQFTSSATKRMKNEGFYAIEANNFKATVEPYSITTFTSYASAGEKYGNIPPVAFAGNDTTILDTIGKGLQVNLNATLSFDPDGFITKYNWAKDGFQINNSDIWSVKLNVGKHTFVLTVTDNDGQTASDTVVIEVKSNRTTQLWLEAECAVIGNHWKTEKDINASNGHYLTTSQGYEATNNPVTDTLQHITYSFNITEKGFYKIWGRILAPISNQNSFWVRIDKGKWIHWNNIPVGSSWIWDDIHNLSNDNDTSFYLNEGAHTLTLTYADNGVYIDKWYITNTGKKPSGKGGVAQGCQDTNPVEINNSIPFSIYPNPHSGNFNIMGTEPIERIVVYSSNGQVAYQLYNNFKKESLHIDLTLPEGLYIVQLIDYKGRLFYNKMIVRKK
ncbi:MAG: T9SS type A sorting domain-containing protein [Bacteroidales bacterium]|nr:T9SS type A sorting domain-containing protein [Bacteroidales bacterium]